MPDIIEPGQPMTIILHQFPYSHFNEKARWALDFKQIAHTRQGYLPGPHAPQIKMLSGQSQTPVLQWDSEIIAGSADIISYLEEKHPSPALFPVDETEHQAALQYCRTLDEELGPATRSLIFSGLINESRYTADMFSAGKSSLARGFYRWTFPLVKPIIAKANGVNADNLARARKITHSFMDDIAEQSRETGYLFGNHFTVADLTAAALLAPIAEVNHPDMQRPQPVPAAVQSVIAEFRDHPATAWVNRIYQQHRAA